MDSSGYYVIAIHREQYKAHRLGWILHYGDICFEKDIDHINGIRSDNRINNLRLVKASENAQNTLIQKRNKIGVIGVRERFDKAHIGSPFEASICFNGKRIFRAFKNIEDAINWRLEMQKEFFKTQPFQRHM